MRIRSIKPEFWRSDDIDALELADRLLFIGLWSYVDDNGVGIDKLASIAADLFAGDMERDPRDTLARISGGLQKLSDGGQIERYRVDGKAYLYIANWSRHQRIDKPAKDRFPLPTCENAVVREDVATVSRESRDTLRTGTGEQGNRGTGEQSLSSTADAADTSDTFDEFWSLYPRKVAKGAAVKAWKTATRKADPHAIMAALKAQTPKLTAKGPDFCPHAATWLNAERWTDETATEPAIVDTGEWVAPPPIDLGPRCPECDRPGGQHFRTCSKAAS